MTPEGIFCGPVSADGHFVIGKGYGGAMSAYPITGGEPRKITTTVTDFNPVQWSADGSSLFGYHTGEFPSKVYSLSLATGRETQVQELKPGSPAGVVMVAPVVVSRDGKNFAYSYNQTLSVLYLVSGLN